MNDLLTALEAAVAWLRARDISLPDDLRADLAEVKAGSRDRREPGRREKEEAERALYRLVLRVFRKQRAKAARYLEMHYPERKAETPDIDLDWDDEDAAELARALQRAAQSGVNLFKLRVPLSIDFTLVNAEAVEAARKYAFGLIKGINDVTRDVLRRVISGFAATPGATLRDVMDMLPFDEERAMMVATTEITRAYAQGEIMAGQALAREFPEVKVKKRWFTNVDDRVCELCGPLDNMEVDLDEGFTAQGGDREGVDGPPLHPRCRCWLETYTVLVEENDAR